jgi:hypothetical protein
VSGTAGPALVPSTLHRSTVAAAPDAQPCRLLLLHSPSAKHMPPALLPSLPPLLARTASCSVLHAAASLPDPRQRLPMASLICAESLRRSVVPVTQLVAVARQLRQVAQALGLHAPVTRGASVPLVQRHSVWLADRSHTPSSGQGLALLQVPLGRTEGRHVAGHWVWGQLLWMLLACWHRTLQQYSSYRCACSVHVWKNDTAECREQWHSAAWQDHPCKRCWQHSQLTITAAQGPGRESPASNTLQYNRQRLSTGKRRGVKI